MSNALAKRLDYLETRICTHNQRGQTVIGFVDASSCTHAIRKAQGRWLRTDDTPDVYFPAKLERAFRSNKRFIVIISGRGAGKSICIADLCLIGAKDQGDKTYCLREFQESIKNSVHSLLADEILRLGFEGFQVQAKTILYQGQELFQFAGLSRNIESRKSAHGFKRYWIEEAETISENSLMILTPTMRNKAKKGLPVWLQQALKKKAANHFSYSDESNAQDMFSEEELEKVSMIFTANPRSIEDPLSKRFINPFQEELDRDGYYEDDLHLIIKMSYKDNAWFIDSGLEIEREWDHKNKPRALYNHVWDGGMYDSVDNPLIMPEWFDACIDAHLKENLGFKLQGAMIAAHDPFDGGPDANGFAVRHGAVIIDIQEKTDGDINEGCDWATSLAIRHGVDYYTFDAGGLASALNNQVSMAFKDKKVEIAAFDGKESPDFKTAIYQRADGNPVHGQKTNEKALRNKRVQYYADFHDRCYLTYRAVVHGEYADPLKMISFDSKIKALGKFRTEACRIPLKPNNQDLIDLYTKEEMAKMGIPSPNLMDAATMSLRLISQYKITNDCIPQPMQRINNHARLR